MHTAMITTSFPGLVRAVGMFFILSVLADHIYFILSAETSKEASEKPPINPIRKKMLFSGVLNNAKENSTCNPYRFKNVVKLTAEALGFIFFIHPRSYRFAINTCDNHFSSPGNRTSFSENNYSYILQGNHHSSTFRRNVTAREYVYAEIAFQKPTTCL
jgi:hypothetical protein